MSTRALVTNEQVAEDLGISHSMVSRIRSGDRAPSIRLMRMIEGVLDWPVAAQVLCLDGKDAYAEGFEAVLLRRYDGVPDDEASFDGTELGTGRSGGMAGL